MLKKEMEKLREELNNSIVEGRSFSEIYQISIKLDELIAKYYRMQAEKKDNV